MIFDNLALGCPRYPECWLVDFDVSMVFLNLYQLETEKLIPLLKYERKFLSFVYIYLNIYIYSFCILTTVS